MPGPRLSFSRLFFSRLRGVTRISRDAPAGRARFLLFSRLEGSALFFLSLSVVARILRGSSSRTARISRGHGLEERASFFSRLLGVTRISRGSSSRSSRISRGQGSGSGCFRGIFTEARKRPFLRRTKNAKGKTREARRFLERQARVHGLSECGHFQGAFKTPAGSAQGLSCTINCRSQFSADKTGY